MSTWNRIPGPKSRKLARRLRQVESRNITYLSEDFPVFWESAQGARVQDVDGNRYLDLTSAFAVTSLGHRAPAVQKALQKQARKIWHGMGDVHPSAVKVELLEALRDIAPKGLSKTILSNSGSEAVESALKTARLATGKPGVIVFDSAYHGLSYGALAVTDRLDFVNPFRDQIPYWGVHFPFPDVLRRRSSTFCLETLEAYLKTGGATPAGPIGAILIEPVQGRGGVRVADAAFLRGLSDIAKRFELLLIADEVMTGLGRTGRNFAVDHAGVVPDLLCLGKALGNGFPISACIGSDAVMQAWPPSDGEAIHTSTFLGNPLGCAMALASLKEFRTKRLAERAAKLGENWKKEIINVLESHPQVAEVRGIGLMVGIELVKDRQTLAPDARAASRVVVECLRRGLIVLSGGVGRNVITLTPPLTISKKDLESATEILCEVISGLAPSSQARGPARVAARPRAYRAGALPASPRGPE